MAPLSAGKARLLELATSECADRVIERGQAIKSSNTAAESKADTEISKHLSRMADNAPTTHDQANMRNVATNYSKANRIGRDQIIKALGVTMRTGTLVKIGSVAALSAVVLGGTTSVLVMNEQGQWVEGHSFLTDSGSTVLTDSNANGLVDTSQTFDAAGHATSAAEPMGFGDTVASIFQALF